MWDKKQLEELISRVLVEPFVPSRAWDKKQQEELTVGAGSSLLFDLEYGTKKQHEELISRGWVEPVV